MYADKNLFDMFVQFGNVSFFVSCVYGNHVIKTMSIVWERLTRIGVNRSVSQCILGDFNEILHNGEKIGGPDGTFVPFNDLIRDCKLTELSITCNGFT